MKSVLITGCNRGIGLALVRQLLKSKSPPDHLIATCRNIEKAEELKEISKSNSNVHILQFDVNHFETYKQFVGEVEKIVHNDGLNVLINNAGISPKFTRIGLVKIEQVLECLKTNTVAPIMLCKALLPLLKLASKKNNALPVGVSRAAIINISSILGSIEDNDTGGFYPYRCSKAALNAATKSLSIDLKDDKVFVIGVHPGWCKTDLGGPNAPLDVNSATEKLIETLNSLNETVSGKFIQYDGTILPW